MQDLFNSIRETYNSLWHVKVLGESLEIVTPMVASNESFVSVFITKRGDNYVVTDGGWISEGYYDCDLEIHGKAYQRLFQYYIDNYSILQTVGHGRTLYYKKVSDKLLVVNAVFELSHFISAVVGGANIQFLADKKEITFRKSVRDYLSTEFDEGLFKFGHKLAPTSSIEFSAMSNLGGHIQLLNVVTGSNPGYYRDSLCRSNMYFDYARRVAEQFRINKTIAILDDTTPSVYNAPPVRECISLSHERVGIVLLPWSNKNRLGEMLAST